MIVKMLLGEQMVILMMMRIGKREKEMDYMRMQKVNKKKKELERERKMIGMDREIKKKYLEWIGKEINGDLGIQFEKKRKVMKDLI